MSSHSNLYPWFFKEIPLKDQALIYSCLYLPQGPTEDQVYATGIQYLLNIKMTVKKSFHCISFTLYHSTAIISCPSTEEWIKKMWYMKNLFGGQQWRNRHREQTYGHGERGGGGEMYGESNIETYITICKIDSQWEFDVCLRELKQGLCINLE